MIGLLSVSVNPIGKGLLAIILRSFYESKMKRRSDHKVMTKEALKELGSREEQGSTWGRVIELWYYDQVNNDLTGRYSNKFTLKDYYNMLKRYTKDWLKRKPHELTRGDGKRVLETLVREGKSKSYVAKVKNTINLVFQWGIYNRYIREVFISPVRGIQVQNSEEKFPEILTLPEIRKFLFEAKKTTTRMVSNLVYGLTYGYA